MTVLLRRFADGVIMPLLVLVQRMPSLGGVGLGWVGLGWVGLGWVGLGWVAFG